MSERVFLAKLEKLPEGQPYQACPAGRDEAYALFKVQDKIYLTDDLCTHGLVSLSGGDLEGTTIFCPLHGGAFDVTTGEAVELPCKRALKTYSVVVENGDVFGLIG